MTQTTEKKLAIRNILEQVGMSDEELYQLLYGKKQEVEIDISIPQLLDEDLWLETEHSAEELTEINQKITALEQLVQSPPQGAQLEALEALLEGPIAEDANRGFLIKRYLQNWRKGIGAFLALLAFSALQKLAVALAKLTTPHLVRQFENAQSRPQARKSMCDFIISQLEQPLPPVVGLLAEAGAILGPTGTLEFQQPLTAAILLLPPEKLRKLQAVLSHTAPEEKPSESAFETAQQQSLKQQNKTSALMTKLVALDRVENLIANQAALNAPELQQQQQQQQQDISNALPQQTPSRRPRGSRRALREAMERENREKERADLAPTNPQARPLDATSPKTTTPQPANSQTPPPVTPPPNAMLTGLQLNAFKGMTATNVDAAQLGRTKSSIPKDKATPPSPTAKPNTTLER